MSVPGDYISPLIAGIQNMTQDGVSLCIRVCEYTAQEIQGYLQGYGVESWGWMVFSDNLVFSVRKKQLRWALYLCERAGLL